MGYCLQFNGRAAWGTGASQRAQDASRGPELQTLLQRRSVFAGTGRLTRRGSSPSRPCQGASRGDEPKAPERDMRVLPVMYDAADERWRTLVEAMPEMEKIDFDDFPEWATYHLPGHESSCADLVLTGSSIMRVGLARVESGLQRSVHEHSSICRALNFML